MFHLGSSKRTSHRHVVQPSLTLKPAIDGPPSPEKIRAYMEQVKRSSMFGQRSRRGDINSGLPVQPPDSGDCLEDRSHPSRKSSVRSNASSMAKRADRPESLHLFSKAIFSRTRKSSLKSSNNESSSTLSSVGGTFAGGPESMVPSARDMYYGRNKQSSRQSRKGSFTDDSTTDYGRAINISVPYNFQHVAHTHKGHLPDLEKANKKELASAIQAHQVRTTFGEKKGMIMADELHFDNFSSENLDESSKQNTEKCSRPLTCTNQGKKSLSSSNLLNLSRLKTPENSRSKDDIDLRRTPPPRPPRSPVSPECPMALPPRVSSQTACDYYNTFNVDISQHRPHTAVLKKGALMTLHRTPSQPPSEQAGKFANKDLPAHPLILPPAEAAWPLTGSSENFGVALTAVVEEEGGSGRRPTATKSATPKFGGSESFPGFEVQLAAAKIPLPDDVNELPERPRTGGSETLGTSSSAPKTAGFSDLSSQRRITKLMRLNDDSWEDDIDYCYENELEADCYFDWKNPSIGEDSGPAPSTTSIAGEFALGEEPYASSPSPPLHAPEGTRFSRKLSFHAHHPNAFRPSRHVSSADDVPELSPSLNSPDLKSPNPPTPGYFHPILPDGGPKKCASSASSFQESHGFNLSPSFLIPSDFASQMEQDQLYERLLDSDPSSLDAQSEPFIFNPGGAVGKRESTIMEGSSARSSFQSSGFSRGSVSFRSLTFSKNNSQESVVLLTRASTNSLSMSNDTSHASVHSAGSLPDLVSSRRREKEERESDGFPLWNSHTRKGSPEEEKPRVSESFRDREAYIISAPVASAAEEHPNNGSGGLGQLSPVAESFDTLSPVAESFKILSPVAESFAESQHFTDRASSGHGDAYSTQISPAPASVSSTESSASTSNAAAAQQHRARKISSCVVPPTSRPVAGLRQRSVSSAQGFRGPRRGSYMLFPSSTT